jgi:hypothetical protein
MALQADLEGLLVQRGLPKRGNKAALVERLWAAMQQDTDGMQFGAAATAQPETRTATSDGATPADSGTAQLPPVQDDVDEDMIIRSGRRSRASRCEYSKHAHAGVTGTLLQGGCGKLLKRWAYLTQLLGLSSGFLPVRQLCACACHAG